MADKIPAAQYLRMSTEHQRYSLENQAARIQKYAEDEGYTVIRTYADPGKSGLALKHRHGLRQLLRDVVNGQADFRAVLVYDISRWGRFQDSDESAHYEFLCKSAGVPVHYCAESFANDSSIPSSVLKALKRAMAAEYSRELSEKVLAGQKKLARLGFKQGGPPGLGYRRMLVSAEGYPKQLLKRGDRKNVCTDRVSLVRGPESEVELVREIFRMFNEEQLGVKAIARKLQRQGVPTSLGGKWNHSQITRILSHPKYVGAIVFNQSTTKLGARRKAVSRAEWIVTPQSHEAIVDPETFAKAQEKLAASTIRKSDQQLLEELRRCWALKGRLSSQLIDEDPGTPAARTYSWRFGSLRRAYELIGYEWRKHPYTSEQMLAELRSLLAHKGRLSRGVIEEAGGILTSGALCWRFGTLSRAFDLVGYAPRRMPRRSDEQIVEALRALLSRNGRLSQKIIDDATGMECARNVRRRFGSLKRAYDLAGYRAKVKSNQQILDELRTLLSAKGKLTKKLMDETPGITPSGTVRWRFGTIGRACQLIGYNRAQNRRKTISPPD